MFVYVLRLLRRDMGGERTVEDSGFYSKEKRVFLLRGAGGDGLLIEGRERERGDDISHQC